MRRWMGGKEELRTGVEGSEHVDCFDGGREKQESSSVKDNGKDRSLVTDTEDRHKYNFDYANGTNLSYSKRTTHLC